MLFAQLNQHQSNEQPPLDSTMEASENDLSNEKAHEHLFGSSGF